MIEQIKDYKEKFFEPEMVEEQIIPGVTEEQLNAPTSVKNINGGGGTLIKAITFTRPASDGTITQDFIGFGFKPTWYTITAIYDGTSDQLTMSEGLYNGTNFSRYVKNGAGGWTSNYVIKIDRGDNGGGVTYGGHEQFLDDGIKLGFPDSDENIKFTITAYNN